MKKKFNFGFTLIELIIVIIILSILGAIIYPKYLDLIDEAHISTDEAVISNLKTGVMIYYIKNKKFPNLRDDLENCLEGGFPDGWVIIADRDIEFEETTIICDGLPSNREFKKKWSYSAIDGSIVSQGEHEP